MVDKETAVKNCREIAKSMVQTLEEFNKAHPGAVDYKKADSLPDIYPVYDLNLYFNVGPNSGDRKNFHWGKLGGITPLRIRGNLKKPDIVLCQYQGGFTPKQFKKFLEFCLENPAYDWVDRNWHKKHQK